MNRAFLLFGAMAIAGVASCVDPVHDNEVAALGPEAPGVPPGPTHRPGQPCLVCHGGSGPGGEQFAFAGTVYQAQDNKVGLQGVQVTVTGSDLSYRQATTNEVGNFFVTIQEWDPPFPLTVQMTYQGTGAGMTTHIGRDGSCGDCHYDPPGAESPGHVYLVLDPSDLPTGTSQ